MRCNRLRTLSLSLAVVLTGTVGFYSTAHASTVISAAAYGYARDTVTQDGFGDYSSTGALVVYNYSGSSQARGIAEFNIGSLSDPVTSAMLNLTGAIYGSSPPSTVSIGVYGYTGNGSVNSFDYQLSASYLGSFSYSGGAADFNVTTWLNTQIASSVLYAGLRLKWESAATGPGRGYVGMNGFNGEGGAPTLTLETAAVPLPSTLPLFAGAGGLLGFVGWRRKKQIARIASAEAR